MQVSGLMYIVKIQCNMFVFKHITLIIMHLHTTVEF